MTGDMYGNKRNETQSNRGNREMPEENRELNKRIRVKRRYE